MANKSTKAVTNAATFTKSELIASAAELDTTPEMLAGALVSVKKEQITIDEAKAAVQAYSKRVVGGKERR